MRILDKYITKQFVLPFLACLFIFFFLCIVADILGHIDDFSEKQVGIVTLYKYYISFLPIIFVQTCPIAIVLSTLLTLGTLNKNNELTGMKASGISILRIVSPFIFAAFVLSLVVLVVNDYFVPEAVLNSTKIKEENIEKKGVLSQRIIENVTLHGEDNRIYYAKRYNVLDRTLEELTIDQQDSLKRVRKRMRADKVCWDQEKKQWKFYNLVTHHLSEKGEILNKSSLQEEVFMNIKEKPEDFLRHQDESSFMNYLTLKKHIHRLRTAGYSPHKELIDLHRKLSFPFANLVIVLLAIPFALNAPRSGAMMGVVLGVGFCLLYYVLEAIILAIGKEGFIPPLLAGWLANIGFSATGIVLLYRLRRPK